jgi:hypothetical protein
MIIYVSRLPLLDLADADAELVSAAASPRGDLESLAYTLRESAGSSVPWARVIADCTATRKGRYRRIVKLKRRYITLVQSKGSRTVFELLLLHARQTPHGTIPNYEALTDLVSSGTVSFGPATASSSDQHDVRRPWSSGSYPVVFVGQIIAVQLLINVSINGHAVADLEMDAFLDPPHSEGKVLPALVLEASQQLGCRSLDMRVLPLATRPPPARRTGLDQERCFPFNPVRAQDMTVCSGPPLYAVGYPNSLKILVPVPEASSILLHDWCIVN